MKWDAPATQAALKAVREATLLGGMRLAADLAVAAKADGEASRSALAAAIEDTTDQLTAIAAVHAAAVADREVATDLVVPLVTAGAPYLREHAAWALGASPPLPRAVPALTRLAESGGFAGALAEATLEAWGELPSGDDEATPVRAPRDPEAPGATVAQLFLHAELDGDLRHAGEGDTGGIATLLVHLGGALLRERLGAAHPAAPLALAPVVLGLLPHKPLDIDAIVASVKKTGRVVVVHEAPKTCGLGGEIVALINEKAFLHLEAPPARVTGFDTPFPYTLENEYLPLSHRILPTLIETARY